MEPVTDKSSWMRFEHRRQPLLSQSDFVWRFFKGVLLAFALLGLWLLLGMVGYHWIGALDWVDSFLNASMIVGGMGPVDPMHGSSAKIFAGCYAIASGVIFLSIFGLVFAPVFHRFLHKFHLESGK
jgi:hypothetical protein